MDLSWTEEDKAFRAEVRKYLEANAPKDLPEDETANFEARRQWQKKLAEDGWVAIHWPEEFGGRGASLLQTVIYNEEYTRARAPLLVNSLGVGLLGPTLMAHGNDEQKQRYLKKVLSAEEIWCQGFSEPNAGSDLAAIQTRAELDGDEYVLNGQKIWTSYGKYADWMFALVRTDPSAPKHQGISYLLVDMHSPGVEARPLKEITGDSLFAEVFFSDVRVPKANLVGEQNDGWRIAMTTLGFERGAGGLAQSVRLRNSVLDLIGDAQQVRRNGWTAFDDPLSRNKIGKWLVEIEVYRYTTLRAISALVHGGSPGPEASINKIFWSEWHKSFTEDAMDILGPLGRVTTDESGNIDSQRWVREYLFARAGTIYAGTSEIQRNIIAERVLGLPKEPRGDTKTEKAGER
ncbi:MAG: acyl-CoA dehydrogenase [Actinobacteria bacterium]|nr:acyl-CoA dehydrogenase [Actinomycetota bacterium]